MYVIYARPQNLRHQAVFYGVFFLIPHFVVANEIDSDSDH